MPGGLLNLISEGNQNIYLTGNPTKTFFKTTYAKHTNFGLQKFRIDMQGARSLRLLEESEFKFKIPRHAELLMDTYIVVRLPHIWSPIYPPQERNHIWAPYEFKWIDDLGCEMIKEIEIAVGGQILQKITGSYMKCLVERDFDEQKKRLFNTMTGNIPDCNDPANAGGRVNMYPTSFYTDNQNGAEPSIKGRRLYIPILSWFGMNSKMAFPLVAMQYNELTITVRLRPIYELFKVRDVNDQENQFPYIQPRFSAGTGLFQMYRFLQSPPAVDLNDYSYGIKTETWDADIHLMATYAFLSDAEVKAFALNEQRYLIKDVRDYNFLNMVGSKKVKLDSLGMVSSWMWYFRRSDAYLRNEWSNFTNWPYNYIPYDLQEAPPNGTWKYNNFLADYVGDGIVNIEFENHYQEGFGPGVNPDGRPTPWMITGDYNPMNEKHILTEFGIMLDGKYRENVQPSGVYDFVEKFNRTRSFAREGLYCYNFCLNNNPYEMQPSGAINLSKFKNIELEFNTIQPTLDPQAQFNIICDAEGNQIGVNNPNWQVYNYTYDLILHEERYNIVVFSSGNASLAYAR
jgi:hypothetical protein